MGERKNRRLLLQVGTVVIVLFLAAILLNALAIFRDHMVSFVDKKQEDYHGTLEVIDVVVESAMNWPWFLTYIQAHYEELGLDEQSFTDYVSVYDEMVERYQPVWFGDMTTEELSGLSEEDQHILCTYECLLLESYIQGMGDEMDLNEITLSVPIGQEEEFVVVRYSRDETREDMNAAAGDTPNVSGPGKVQRSMVRWDGMEGEDKAQIVRSLTDRSLYLFLYHPVKSGNRTIAYLSVSYELSETLRDVLKSIISVESFTLCVLLLTAVFILLLLNSIAVRPLVWIQKSVREYKENKDSGTVVAYTEKLHSRNEVGLLAKDISDMAVEIDRFTEEVSSLSAEKERISTELSIASKIQLQMLSTDFPERREFALAASVTPAREIGGDFYDFFYIDEDHLALVMGDVSGKGVPAALFMVAAILLIRNTAMAEHDHSPAMILNKVNEQLTKNNKEMMFVTVWLGILTISTGQVIQANAGHEDPALRRKDGEFVYLERKHGLVLGALKGTKYTEDVFALTPGDTLFIYTDGLPDASNGEGKRLGHERALESLNRFRDDPPGALLTHLHAEVDAYVGGAESFDDLTMMALRWYGAGAVSPENAAEDETAPQE